MVLGNALILPYTALALCFTNKIDRQVEGQPRSQALAWAE